MADLKLDTFIKVLLMTTSDTDGEALAAIRRANSMLRNAHIDWDKLLRGKVTVVADPFNDIPAPRSKPPVSTDYTYTPPQPRQPPRPPRPQYRPQPVRLQSNQFTGHCFSCDDYVPRAAGYILNIPNYGSQILCSTCETQLSNGSLTPNAMIYNNNLRTAKKAQAQHAAASRPPRTKRKVTTADLMKDIDF